MLRHGIWFGTVRLKTDEYTIWCNLHPCNPWAESWGASVSIMWGVCLYILATFWVLPKFFLVSLYVVYGGLVCFATHVRFTMWMIYKRLKADEFFFLRRSFFAWHKPLVLHLIQLMQWSLCFVPVKVVRSTYWFTEWPYQVSKSGSEVARKTWLLLAAQAVFWMLHGKHVDSRSCLVSF